LKTGELIRINKKIVNQKTVELNSFVLKKLEFFFF
jgi:hypothetical protein